MQVDIFRDILVPVVGGLGIFMLGLEFMSNGIQNLAVNRMRALLARIAGTPIKGVFAGTLITGVIQSSTAMTVMVVGSGQLRRARSAAGDQRHHGRQHRHHARQRADRAAARAVGPAPRRASSRWSTSSRKSERVKNIALACMGFALIFYGLNLMTGGLRPLRNMPEVMSVISSLKADSFIGVIYCVLIAALHHGDDPFLVGDDRHRDGTRRRRRARLADRGGLLAGRRPRNHDHVVDGLAQSVEERQACRLRTHLVQHHRRRW